MVRKTVSGKGSGKKKAPSGQNTYVLNGKGEVVGATSGEAPREAYEGWIDKALNGT